jgi:hypothetical protein
MRIKLMKGYENKKEQSKEMGLCTYRYKKERKEENLKRKAEAKRGPANGSLTHMHVPLTVPLRRLRIRYSSNIQFPYRSASISSIGCISQHRRGH